MTNAKVHLGFLNDKNVQERRFKFLTFKFSLALSKTFPASTVC